MSARSRQNDHVSERAERLARLDMMCDAAGELYPNYDTFGLREDGAYYIQTKERVLALMPGSSVIDEIMKRSIA